MSVDVLLYETLGVEPDASPCQIAQAFHKKRNENTNENMQELICSAYEILISPKLRRIYDREGLPGIDTDDDDPPPLGRRPVQTFTLEVSLKKLYLGCTIPLTMETKRVCSRCRGSGRRTVTTPCPLCQATGVVYFIGNPAPLVCPDCEGEGVLLSPTARACRYCGGAGADVVETAIDVDIEPGTDDGDEIDIDEVRVIVVQKKHDVFERCGCDLLVTKDINVSQALCGVRFPLAHLDGRTLVLESGETVLTPGKILTVENEGFPVKGRPGERGDLFILFDVVFPLYRELAPALVSALVAALPPPPAPDNADATHCALSDLSTDEYEYEEEEEVISIL